MLTCASASPEFIHVLDQHHDTLHIDLDLLVTPIAEDSQTLASLLWLCYLMADPHLGDRCIIYAVLEAATRYKMTRAIDFSRRESMEQISEYPLELHSHASWLGN